MSNLPAIPEPGDIEFDAPERVRAVLDALPAWVPAAEDELVAEAHRMLAAAEVYGARWSAVCRLMEVLIGERLGTDVTQGQRPSLASESQWQREDRRRFRLLARARVAVEPLCRRYAGAREPERLSRAEALRVAMIYRREQTPAADPGEAVVDPTAGDATVGASTLLAGDFRERLAVLADRSVDLILTDPPYPREALPLWRDLAELAAAKLGDRGRLVAWSGQLMLPEVLDQLRAGGLSYGWTFCLPLTSASRIMGRHILQNWKPVLAFSRDTWPSGQWAGDVLPSPAPDKSLYRWQQTVPPAAYLIDALTPRDGLVVDPFMGVGTFAVAAVQAGRRFLGCEMDSTRLAVAAQRLKEL